MATGTTVATYSDRECLFRLQTLIIDVGTEVVRHIFNQKLQNQPLSLILAMEKMRVNQCRRNKAITPSQFDILYPRGGEQPTIADFDITLMIVLLGNLPCFGLNQSYQWYVTPQPPDMSLEADLCRLRMFRSEVAHVASTTRFRESFEAKWTEVEQVSKKTNLEISVVFVLLRLNSNPYPLENLEEMIYKCRYGSTEQWLGMQRMAGSQQPEETTPAKQRKTQFTYDLQNGLISFYKRQYKTLNVFPLVSEDELFLKLYVMPDILTVKVTRSRDGDKKEKLPVRTLRDVFYQDNKLCSNILLTADVGLGKTAFCKRLALTWCYAKKPDESGDSHFLPNEIAEMGTFSFLFLVMLRDSPSESDIDMLILYQICSQLQNNYDLKDVRNILDEERCLIILDGLDEWTRPLERGESFIPNMKARENVAVLTTTREVNVRGQNSSHIDKTLELIGLNNHSAKKLKRSVISHLYRVLDESIVDVYENEFNTTMQNKHMSDLTHMSGLTHMSDLTHNPFFSLLFLYLWFHKVFVGKSLADLYSGITELVLLRTVQKDGIQIPGASIDQVNIPRCFDNHALCKTFYKLLKSLGELAFQTFINNTPIFDYYIAEQYLSREDLKFCHTTKIIEFRVNSFDRKKRVSFSHKTLQEFLMSLYMSSAPDQKSVSEEVLSKIKCVKDILDISKVLTFIASINEKSAILCELQNIINNDAITQEYRKSLQDEGFPHQLKDFQDMIVSCCKEFPRENETSLSLQDVFIDNSCQEESYREILKQMTTRNKRNVRSVYIDMPDMEYKLFDIPGKVFGLSDLENIEKITYKYEQDIDGISPLLNSTIKCLSLSCYWPTTGCCSRFLVDKVTSFQTLTVLQIGWTKMKHNELELMLGYLTGRDDMVDIVLEGLSCTDHCSTCPGLHVNLSQHPSLKKLTLYQLPLSKVSVDMTSVEKCCLQYLYNQDLKLELLKCTSSKLHTFYCGGLESDAAINVVLETLRVLPQIKQVKLTWINLGTRKLCFMNIERLQLVRITMEESSFRELVDTVPAFHQTVEVYLHYCTIKHGEEFETVKENMKSSRHFTILVDEENWLEFATKKNGD